MVLLTENIYLFWITNVPFLSGILGIDIKPWLGIAPSQVTVREFESQLGFPFQLPANMFSPAMALSPMWESWSSAWPNPCYCGHFGNETTKWENQCQSFVLSLLSSKNKIEGTARCMQSVCATSWLCASRSLPLSLGPLRFNGFRPARNRDGK